MTAVLPRWLTTAEAAAYASRHPDTLRDAAKAGELRGTQRPSASGKGHWRFKVEDLDRWLEGEFPPVAVPIDRRRRKS